MQLTLKAKAHWEKIPKDVRMKLLNNIWCSHCSMVTGIAKIEGTVEKKDLILRGKCVRCGKRVARLIEGD